MARWTSSSMMVAAVVAVALLGLGAAACGGGGGGDDVPDAGGNMQQCVPGAAFDISGQEGVLASLNVHVNASGLVETDTTAELLLLMDTVQTGTSVSVVATLCDIKIPDVPISGQDMPVHFEVTPALIASVPPVMSAATLSGTTTCSSFTSDEITIVIGAKLDPMATAPLPEANSMGSFTTCSPIGTCDQAITSNCACDQENDLKPGATLLASNTPAVDLDEVYVDLRTTFTLTGQVYSSDLIQGEVEASLEQGILGCHKANNTECSNGEVSAIKNINPDITQSVNDPSTFRAVGTSGLDCATLIAMKDQLFPR